MGKTGLTVNDANDKGQKQQDTSINFKSLLQNNNYNTPLQDLINMKLQI